MQGFIHKTNQTCLRLKVTEHCEYLHNLHRQRKFWELRISYKSKKNYLHKKDLIPEYRKTITSSQIDPLSFPFLHRRSLKHIPYTSCLLLEEFGVLGTLLAPCRVKRCCVLIHQVSVFCPTRTSKVFDLKDRTHYEQVRHRSHFPKLNYLMHLNVVSSTKLLS